MARCSDRILAVAESFDCSLIHLNHTVMSHDEDYASSNDEGIAGGNVLILKHRQKAVTHVHRKQQRESYSTLQTFY